MHVLVVVAVVGFLLASFLPWTLVDYSEFHPNDWAQVHRGDGFRAGCVIHSAHTLEKVWPYPNLWYGESGDRHRITLGIEVGRGLRVRPREAHLVLDGHVRPVALDLLLGAEGSDGWCEPEPGSRSLDYGLMTHVEPDARRLELRFRLDVRDRTGERSLPVAFHFTRSSEWKFYVQME
jgi:hypothetical protein